MVEWIKQSDRLTKPLTRRPQIHRPLPSFEFGAFYALTAACAKDGALGSRVKPQPLARYIAIDLNAQVPAFTNRHKGVALRTSSATRENLLRPSKRQYGDEIGAILSITQASPALHGAGRGRIIPTEDLSASGHGTTLLSTAFSIGVSRHIAGFAGNRPERHCSLRPILGCRNALGTTAHIGLNQCGSGSHCLPNGQMTHSHLFA
jgi:hypothetical protein